MTDTAMTAGGAAGPDGRVRCCERLRRLLCASRWSASARLHAPGLAEVVREQGPPRVIEFTCECEDIIYERCREGGLVYIRRTTRLDGVVQQIHETYRWRSKEAQDAWIALLNGEAR